MQHNTNLDRQALEAIHGRVWDEQQLSDEFEIKALIHPKVVVVRKSDGQVGSVTCQNVPRYYFDFEPAVTT